MEACPTCGQAAADRFAICGYCGERLRGETAVVDGPRPVTVFFSDLKGSTTLGERLDSEALREVLARYFDAMTAELEREGGTVEKFIGDAIMAVFGLPVARPDDAVRAVRAAAATKRVLAALNDELEREYGVRLVTRTGVATGTAIVGVVREGEHVLTGDVVQLASRLEQGAPPSEVLIAESTRDAVLAAAAELVVEPATVAAAPTGPALPACVLIAAPLEEPADAVGAAARLCRRCGETNPADFVFCGTCGTGLAAVRAGESRRTVTIVFSDVRATDLQGGRLAPDVLRDVLSRAFDVARTALEHHGATVEKYVGDAVMAVFGLPVLHEDDALRAVRAAASMTAAIGTLSAELAAAGVRLGSRTGVNTGEVVAGDAALAQRLVTGDTVNTAARLEQAAPEDGILLGGQTYALVREAIVAEPVEPLALKGKAERVPAYRYDGLRSLDGPRALDGRARREGAMLGRDAELDHLRRRFHEAVVQQGPRLVTIVGDAGIGKSRLVREFEAYADGMATVLRGRCLSYGAGITFWPIREIVRSAAGIEDADAPAAAQARLADLTGDREVAERLGSILGLTAMPFPMAELFWAVRRFFELLAARRPLVVVVDGVHWAAPAFVELVEHLRATLSESPLLIVFVARHELLEAFPDWGRRSRESLIVLSPLGADDASAVLGRLLGGDAGRDGGRDAALRSRILDVAEGNPLYLEQVVSMLIDTGALRFDDGAWVRADEGTAIAVPPTIQALLAARVDAIPRAERRTLDPASVIGHSFAQPAVEALVDDEIRPAVPASLAALAGRHLVRPDPGASAAEPWFRFQNLLIRDAAYRALLKRSRVALHERFVAWADAVNRERGREREFEEISGYHLEQSYRYRKELGALDTVAVAVGRDAARRLTSAGRRAFARGDMAAAANLLGRAIGVLQDGDADRRALLPELGEAFIELGRFDEASATLEAAIGACELAGDDRLRRHAALIRLLLEFYTVASTGWSGRAIREAESAVAAFEPLDDHAGLTRAWRVLFGVHATACRYGDAADAAERIVTHATLAGDVRQEARGATGYAQAALLGPIPIAEAIDRCRELLARTAGDRRSEAMILLAIAELEGMTGSFASARERALDARSMLAEFGSSVALHSIAVNSWRAHALAGDLTAAEAELRRDYDALGRMGERFVRSTIAGLLGQVVFETGRIDEAAALAGTARELADADDIGSQALWRSLEAKVLARRGETGPARALAEAALAVLEPADSPILRADALVDLADVLEAGGDRAAACDRLLEALRLYDAKGGSVAAERARDRLASDGWLVGLTR